MPKYYRFRATTPSRKLKRKHRDRDRDVERPKCEPQRYWLDLTIACTPAPSWYLRRTSWRESPPLASFPRQLAADLRSSLQLNNRPIFVFKTPYTSESLQPEVM